MIATNNFVQYGCGLDAPLEWINFDVSPTLKIQKIPLLNLFSRRKVIFPSNVLFGDIVKGLPNINPNSCDGVYCSHTLEHLALEDLRIALKNTYSILKEDGIFRCVVPDMFFYVEQYLQQKKAKSPNAGIEFIKSMMMGIETRPRNLKDFMIKYLGNSHHLWMWDYEGLSEELLKVGFKSIRRCSFNDSKEPKFKIVESESRFIGAVAIEAIK